MARPEVRVKEYKNAKEFDRDARRMVRDGWRITAQSHGSTHVNYGRTQFTTRITGGLNMMVPKIGGASFTKGKIVVTWMRGGDEPAPAASSLAADPMYAFQSPSGGISALLHSWGVPGFRQQNRWHQLLASLVYAFIAIGVLGNLAHPTAAVLVLVVSVAAITFVAKVWRS